MLASLFRGNSGQRQSQYIESVTDDAHTRNLLFGQSQHVSHFAASPPPSPFGSPVLRPSSFDDQSGLELEERDVRILLAQDAHGGEDKPTLLFDSWSSGDRHDEGQRNTRSPLPADWRPEGQSRNRSSTFSESQSSWAKPAREAAPKDDPFLECMFGVPSSAKTTSATKLHVIPAKNRKWNASERGPRRPSDNNERRRAPLARAHTSAQQLSLSSMNLRGRDALLVTRLFHVPLNESVKIVNSKSADTKDGQDRPAKLVERRVPAFAIGVIFYLPPPTHRPSSSHSRHRHNSSYGASNVSASSSFGSDMHSSWTFLDIIPTSLSSSVVSTSDANDRRVDVIVENWDIVLRCLSRLQHVSHTLLKAELEKILLQHNAPSANKTPKEKNMQRPNQRMIAIQNINAIARSAPLTTASAETSKRIIYALRIPRVITGLGLTAGHWIDEARTLYRACGSKQQNFFLFNLLTAFLGSNMQWLEHLAPEWYQKQFQASHDKVQECKSLASRTVIVSDHKGLARRLVYVLASFLPGRAGIGALQRYSVEGQGSTSMSPASNSLRTSASLKRGKNYVRAPQEANNELLSTSAASYGSRLSAMQDSPHKLSLREDSNKYDIGGDGIRTLLQTGAGTSSAVVPQAAATPTAHISVRDSYFSESAIVETNDSIASADLSKVLNRATSSHRRTSSVSSRLSSFVNGIWSNRPGTPGESTNILPASQKNSPAAQNMRTVSSALPIQRSSTLQMMVDELDIDKTKTHQESNTRNRSPAASRHTGFGSAPPKMHVDPYDGVIDVDLDLPGFLSAASLSPPAHPRLGFAGGSFEGSKGSTHSHHSASYNFGKPIEKDHINVGGYLRRHHQDFVLHAVRSYSDLLEDVKGTMRAELTPSDTLDRLQQDAVPSVWVPVCSTLVADTRTFTIRRFTLRRQYDMKSLNSVDAQLTTSGRMLVLCHEEIVEEKVMDFDATLADAIEQMLNVSGSKSGLSAPPTRTHSRNVSLGSATSNRNIRQDLASTASSGKRYIRADQQDLVVGALETVVHSVNKALNDAGTDKSPDLRMKQNMGTSHQENALREGVKKWMIDVEHTSVW